MECKHYIIKSRKRSLWIDNKVFNETYNVHSLNNTVYLSVYNLKDKQIVFSLPKELKNNLKVRYF